MIDAEYQNLLDLVDAMRNRFLAEFDQLREQIIRSSLNHQKPKPSMQPSRSVNQFLTAKELAERLQMKEGTVANGDGGTLCLRRVRVKQGRYVYPLLAIEIHERNSRQFGKCNTCDEEYRRMIIEKQ